MPLFDLESLFFSSRKITSFIVRNLFPSSVFDCSRRKREGCTFTLRDNREIFESRTLGLGSDHSTPVWRGARIHNVETGHKSIISPLPLSFLSSPGTRRFPSSRSSSVSPPTPASLSQSMFASKASQTIYDLRRSTINTSCRMRAKVFPRLN